jgi:hypothetical protein
MRQTVLKKVKAPGKSNWKGNGEQNKRLPHSCPVVFLQSSPTVISPRERSSVNTNLSQAEPGQFQEP